MQLSQPSRSAFLFLIRLFAQPGLKILAAAIVGIVALGYFNTKLYTLPPSAPFSGSYWYNPYNRLSEHPLKANFHAHSISWGGLTNGHQSGEKVVDAYLKNNYDVVSLSDYHRINSAVFEVGNIAIPVFEHGMNLTKAHHLAIGATEVIYDNVLLWQNSHTKQSMIDRLHEIAPVVCVNHPGMRRSHTYSSIQQLTGYELLEVLNGHRKYVEYWDSVLTAGRPVWILGNDDCHDIDREKFCYSWNLVSTEEKTMTGVLSALKAGQSMAVRRSREFATQDELHSWLATHRGNVVRSVEATSGTINIVLKQTPKEVRLIGPHGKLLAVIKNSDHVQFAPPLNASYVRAEIDLGDFSLYLNPMIRYDGVNPPTNIRKATVSFERTLIMRLAIVLGYLLLLTLMFPNTIRTILYGQTSNTAYENNATRTIGRGNLAQ